MLALLRPGDEEGPGGSYLAKDFEGRGEILFLAELVETVLDIVNREIASRLRSRRLGLDLVFARDRGRFV